MTIEIPPTGMTLILGGARSGKSSYAEKIARETARPALYIATATAFDDEMRARIANHRAARPANWQTFEVPLRVGEAVLKFSRPEGPILLDCVTLLMNNILMSLPENVPFETVMEHVREEIEALIAAQTQIGGQWLVVSNEVGLGIVPAYPLGRIYRDALGWANQRLAQEAARVLFMVAGIPMLVK